MRTVHWYSGRNRIQYVTPKHSLQRIAPFSIISIEILRANAVIDTFVTSKGFSFLFNHITVWMAFSIESNKARPLPRVKGWAATTCFYESRSNHFWHLTFVLTQRGRQTGLVPICRGRRELFFFQLACTQTAHTCTVALHQGIYLSLLCKWTFHLYLPSYLQFLWNLSPTLWCSIKWG